MFKSAVYYETSFLGEVEIFPQNANTGSWIREIRISHLSPPSERCPPLAVLHTVAACGVCFKMEAKSAPSNDSPLFTLHATLATENKTAVILLGEEELHLVAMASRKNSPNACFWGFVVPARLYDSSLVMLNLRCLGIVFDLDETLLVANTMRSFEDRIDALQRKINNETDAQRIATMVTEIKRYQEDKSILKQYVETDQVVENGNVFKVQPEMVPPLSDNHQLITRPVIRLHEKSIILTRVNPSIRDTSVLVRLRPAWEELRSYLTARGRKRFEVYVCTMAERDYALEMWRLLDPDSNLINSSKLLDRIVCVKSGSKKSLLNVFQGGICHPKMALVIDDRLKVWDEKDQPRVHVVPAFAPYYAPQAEVNSSIPVLHVARNVACNVRGGFFKEFDEGILPRIGEVLYEDEIKDFPPAPDVGHFLISEDDTTALNINRDQPGFDGMADGEVERRLKEGAPSVQPTVTNFGPRPVSSLQHVIPPSFGTTSLTAMQMMMPLPNIQVPPSVAAVRPLGPLSFSEPSFQGSPAREEGEVPESELDPDTRRRLLILQHGQDTREPTPQFPMTPPLHVSIPPVQSQGSWFPVEEEVKPRQESRAHKEFSRESDVVRYRKRPRHPSFMHGGEISVPSDRVHHETRRLPMQLHNGGERLRPNNSLSNFNCFQGEEMPMGRNYSSHKDSQFEHRKDIVKQAESPAGVLQEIALKCGNKMEFRSILCDTTELQFSNEVWFVGEKLGEGVGKTRKEAQHRAAEISLRNLADKYLSTAPAGLNTTYGDTGKENGPLSDSNSHGYQPCNRNGFLSVASTSEDPRTFDQRLENSGRQSSIISLKELCVMEGFSLDFQVDHPPSNGSISKGEVSAQVEIAGQILGRGVGATWEEAKFQAAAEALGTLRSMLGQFTQKRSSSPRILKYRTRHCPICAKNFVDDRYFASARPKPLPVISNKRLKPEISQTLNRLPSSGRYSKSEMPVP